jgi:hypothetical protein
MQRLATGGFVGGDQWLDRQKQVLTRKARQTFPPHVEDIRGIAGRHHRLKFGEERGGIAGVDARDLDMRVACFEGGDEIGDNLIFLLSAAPGPVHDAQLHLSAALHRHAPRSGGDADNGPAQQEQRRDGQRPAGQEGQRPAEIAEHGCPSGRVRQSGGQTRRFPFAPRRRH